MIVSTDRIESSIVIDAAAERVWQLVSRPGWWINDDVLDDSPTSVVGDYTVVHDARFGDFPVRLVEARKPSYIAFRWVSKLGDDGVPVEHANSTLTEFAIEPTDSGVMLRVTESGFDSLDLDERARREQLEGNDTGWNTELGLAKAWAE